VNIITVIRNHVFVYFCPVEINDLSYIALYLHHHGYSTNSQAEQLLIGMEAQLIENCLGIAEVEGSNPDQP